MTYRITTSDLESFEDRANGGGTWAVAFAAAQKAETLADADHSSTFAVEQVAAEAVDEGAEVVLREVAADDPEAVLTWQPERGWELLLPPEDQRTARLDL